MSEYTQVSVFPYYGAPKELQKLASGSGDDCDWVIMGEDKTVCQMVADRLAVFECEAHVIVWRHLETNVFITRHA